MAGRGAEDRAIDLKRLGDVLGAAAFFGSADRLKRTIGVEPARGRRFHGERRGPRRAMVPIAAWPRRVRPPIPWSTP